jgi:hypothetical protein
MPEKQLYEYAVIRIVPRVEREEFLNVGLILFCKKARYIQVLLHVDAAKLGSFAPELDIEQLEKNLLALQCVALGQKTGGRMALEEIPERFRWLTALRSSALQTSRPHPGLTTDLEATTQQLFRELVL